MYDTDRAPWRQAATVTVLFAFMALMVALPLRGHATETPTMPAETEHSEAGVIATDDHWSRAELAGDTAFLEGFLMPSYRSVNDDGTVHDKSQIVAGAAKRSGRSLEDARKELDGYRKTSPYDTRVLIEGDTAIITFIDPKRGEAKGVLSSDILVYRDGKWRAWYSQHAMAKKSL